MTINEHPTLTEKAVAAMQAAIRTVVEEHARRNKPLVVWRNGAIVWEMPHPVRAIGESEHLDQMDMRD
jgi:hypothetical protein